MKGIWKAESIQKIKAFQKKKVYKIGLMRSIWSNLKG